LIPNKGYYAANMSASPFRTDGRKPITKNEKYFIEL